MDPRDHLHLYLGTLNGWIYESRDGGGKWTRLASVGKRDDLALDNIVVDPADPQHLMVGAWVLDHPDGGLYVSRDGGKSWTSQSEMQGQSIRALSLAPSNPKIVIAGTLDGVFRSSDGGEHWSQISPKGNKEIHEIESVAVDPFDPGTIYAGTWHLPWKTTDGGQNWKSIKQGIIEDSDVFSIIIDPKQSNVVYASACSGIYKSEDGGGKFTGGVGVNKAQGIPSTARRTRVLMQDPEHLSTVFAGTTEGLYRTDDSGKYWVAMTGSEVIVNDVYVDPTNSKRVLLATDRGGVLASDDGGSSFRPSNTGFSSRQITSYVADARHPAKVYVGVVNDKEWGGVFESDTGGLSWQQLSSGLDGRDVFSLGQAPDGTMLAGTGHGIYQLKGAEWVRAAEDASRPVHAAVEGKPVVAKRIPSRATSAKSAANGKAGVAARTSGKTVAFDGSVYGFATTGNTMYAATSQGVMQSTSSGARWKMVAALPQAEWRYIAAAKANVGAATLDGLVLSNDAGSTWLTLKLPPKVDQVSALSVDGAGGVWVAGREGVYYSTDKGGSWQTLKNLYVRNVNSIFYDEAADRILVTSNGPATVAFAVQVATMQVSFWDTGWNLRFVRPVGDHLIAGTLFDGMVVQPRMIESVESQQTAAR